METERTLRSGYDNIWNPLFISAFTVNFLVHVCTQMMNTLTAKYADFLGAPETIIGLATGLFALTALIFKIFSAPAIDTFNRKYILMGAIGVIFLAFVAYTLSYNIPTLLMARLLQGTGQAFTTTCCLTIASDSLPMEKMSSGIGYFALTSALGQAIAPAIGLWLIGIIGYNCTFAVLAGFMLIAFAAAACMKIEFTRTKKFAITLDSIVARECAVPATILFLLGMEYCCVTSFLVLYGESRGITGNLGLFFTVYAVTMLLSRPLIGTLADRFGPVKVLIPSMCCFAVSFLVISFSSSLMMLLVAAFVSAFGYGGCMPAVQAVAMCSVPKERRGAASCTSYIGQDMGNLVGPTLGGAIVQAAGYASMWRVMIIPMGIAMVMAVLCRERLNNPGGQTETAETVPEHT